MAIVITEKRIEPVDEVVYKGIQLTGPAGNNSGNANTLSDYAKIYQTTAPVASQVAVWDAANEIRGYSGLTYDGSILKVSGDQVLTSADKDFKKTFLTLTVGSGITWDLLNGYNAKLSGALTANATLTMNNVSNGDSGTLLVLNGSSSYTITLPSGSYVGDPSSDTITIESGTSKRTLLGFVYDGTNYWWTSTTYTLSS